MRDRYNPTPQLPIAPYYSMPNSPALDLAQDAIFGAADLREVRDNRELIGNIQTTTVTATNGGHIIASEGDKGRSEVFIPDAEAFGRGVSKLFDFCMMQLNGIVRNGHPTRGYITFSLSDLVEHGLYATQKEARKGFNDAANGLTTLKIKGSLRLGKQQHSTDKLRVLFTGADIVSNQCVVYINSNIDDWTPLLAFYFALPVYYYSLSHRARRLCYEVFSTARQRGEELKRHDYFTIKLSTVRAWLNLRTDTANPKRDVKDEINRVVQEINEAHLSTYVGMKDLIEIVSYDGGRIGELDSSARLTEYLEKGRLKVNVEGLFSEKIKKIRQRKRR